MADTAQIDNSNGTNNGILLEGPLWKKGWVGWSLRYARLEEHNIRIWKDTARESFSGCIDLRLLTSMEDSVPTAKVHKPHCFMIKIKLGKNDITFYLATDTAELKDRWLKNLRAAIDLAKASLPTESGAASAAVNITSPSQIPPSPSASPSWKARFLSKIANSALGRAAISSFVSEDGVAIIQLITDSLKKLKLHTPFEATADEFQTIIYTVGVDVIYLINDKVVPKDTLLLLRDPAFKLWSEVLDMLEISFVFDEEQIVRTVEQLWDSVSANVLLAMPEPKRQQLEKIFKIFNNKKHIISWYTDDLFEKERQAFRVILRKVWNRTFQLEKKGGEF